MNGQETDAEQAGAPTEGGRSFGLENILSDAFEAFKNHFGILMGTFLAFAAINVATRRIPIITLFIMPHFIVGFSLIMFKALRKEEPPKFTDLFQGFACYIPVLVAGLLMGLLILFGTVCLVIPGIFLALMWSQTLFLLADDIKEVEASRKTKGELSGWGAMQRSAALMYGHKLRFFGYAIVLALIGMAGALALGIGILVTMPFAWLAFAAFYNRLSRTN